MKSGPARGATVTLLRQVPPKKENEAGIPRRLMEASAVSLDLWIVTILSKPLNSKTRRTGSESEHSDNGVFRFRNVLAVLSTTCRPALLA